MRRPASASNHDAALAYVTAHPDPSRITIAELIEGTGLKRATLYRAFEAHGGVYECLVSLRLETARELLASGLSCREVSKRCGFRTSSHFSKRFFASYGMTARSYQAQCLAERVSPMS